MAETNNGLRDEGGALIGGLVVEDYVRGIEDFKAGNPPPDLDTTPSYDLGRQRAAEERAVDLEVKNWIRADEERRDKAMRELLPPNLYDEYRQKIDAIRAREKSAVSE